MPLYAHDRHTDYARDTENSSFKRGKIIAATSGVFTGNIIFHVIFLNQLLIFKIILQDNFDMEKYVRGRPKNIKHPFFTLLWVCS